jgi:hypothetical protein
LRQLQSIRLGQLELGDKTFKTMVTQAPKDLNDTLAKLDLLTLFAKPPAWTEGSWLWACHLLLRLKLLTPSRRQKPL